MKYEDIVRCQFSVKKEKAMHFHPDIEILYVLDGNLEIAYEDRKYQLDTDDFILVNSNVRHEYHTKSDVLLGSLFIDYTMLTEIFNGEQLLFLCNSAENKSDNYEKMRYYIRQIFNYYQTSEGQAIVLKNSIYYQLIYLITTDFVVKKGMQQYDSLRGIQNERLNEILSYIMSNYREPITLNALAERLYLSHTYLSRYIKQNFGMSFLKLVNNIRLEHAMSDLLYTDKSVLKIAMDNGFPNQAGFNHAFQQSYHTTPAEYRQQMLEKREKEEQEENVQKVMDKVEQYLTSNLIVAPVEEDASITILEVDVEQAEPIVPYWRKLINIGSASDLLRFDVREQIRNLKNGLQFEAVRFWGLLSDEMMIEMKGENTRYNFKLIDQVFDFLQELGVTPHVELGFKKSVLFGKVDRSMLASKYATQMDVIEKNRAFLEELIKHLTRRYTVETVENWYFELERNSVIQEQVSMDAYLNAFDTLAGIFRTYAPNVKIGGAGFSLNFVGKEFPQMIEKWMERKNKPDFISIHSYPYISDEHVLDAGRNPYSTDDSYLYHTIQEAKQVLKEKGCQVPEFFVTEWSSTLSNRNCLNDGAYKSAYILKNLIENYGEVDAVGYWVATDIFAETIESIKPLFGGCGLLSRDGIRKPAYYAFDHLNHLGKYYLGKNKNAIVSKDKRGLYFICCHNYKHFNFRYYSRNEDEIEVENQKRLYEDNESLQMGFRLNNVNNGEYIIKIYSVSEENGNVQQEWRRLDYYNEPSIKEIRYLQEICQPKLSIRRMKVENHTLTVETRMSAQEIQGIVIAEF